MFCFGRGRSFVVIKSCDKPIISSELANTRNRPASQRHPILARARILNVIVPFQTVKYRVNSTIHESILLLQDTSFKPGLPP